MRAKLIAILMLVGLGAWAQSPQDYVVMRAWEHVRRGAVAELWTPADLGNDLAVWLDASDASTLWEDTSATTAATNNGLVARWDDKSGNDRDFLSQGADPFYNNSDIGIDFSLDDDRRLVGPNNPVAQTAAKSAYVVNKPGGAAADDRAVIVNLHDSTTAGSQGHLTRELGYRTAGRTWISSTPTAANTRALVALTQTEGGNLHASTKIYLDGSEITRTAGTDGERVDVAAVMIMGYGNTLARHDGTINEFILTNKEDSLDTRQKIEGYLAHKWGLTANLPSDHPYKNAAPTN